MEAFQDATLPPSAIDAAKRVLAAWEEIDLEGKKSGWDALGLTISQFQETSSKNRRSLAEQTKAFKSSGGEKKDFAPLLKAYQAEIDSITKRAKHAESAYLGVYQALYDAPDVLPLLRSFVPVAARVAGAEQEARRLRQEMEIVRADAAAGKALQASLHRLQERNTELEERLTEKVREALEERAGEMEARVLVFRQREADLEARIREGMENLAAMQRANEAMQGVVFEANARMEEERASKQHEIDGLMEELERSQARVSMLEQRLSAATAAATAASPPLRPASATPAAAAAAAAAGESLLGEGELTTEGEEGGAKSPALLSASASASASAADAAAAAVAEDPEVAKERLVSRLHMQLQQMQDTLQRERDEWEGALQQAQQQVAEREAQVQQVQAELQARASPAQVEELRQQIRVLQVRHGGRGQWGSWAAEVGVFDRLRMGGGMRGLGEDVPRAGGEAETADPRAAGGQGGNGAGEWGGWAGGRREGGVLMVTGWVGARGQRGVPRAGGGAETADPRAADTAWAQVEGLRQQIRVLQVWGRGTGWKGEGREGGSVNRHIMVGGRVEQTEGG
ncbi:unnamed protein product [Closterium sp. NIES-65]|nr:unnamed protein product [Closterium sp. NIES-65]